MPAPRRRPTLAVPLLLLALAVFAAAGAAGCAAGGGAIAGDPGGAEQVGTAPGDSGAPGPWGGALDPPAEQVRELRGLLLVANEFDHSVVFVDPDARRRVARVLVGWGPRELVPAADGERVFVANFGGDAFGEGMISVLSVAELREVDRLDLRPYGRLHGIAPTRNGVYLYVASEERRAILEYNLLSRTVGRTFTLPRGVPHLLALNETETRLFVTDAAGPYLYAVDLTSGQVQEARVGASPETVVMSPDGLALWVANRDDNSVSIVDPYTLTERLRLSVGRAPVRIAFTVDGRKALVVNAGESAVAVYDAVGLARLASVPVGGYPLAIVVDPNGKTAYVGSTRDDAITVVDLASNTTTGEFRVGLVPVGMTWAEVR